MLRTATRLADGRELLYYSAPPDTRTAERSDGTGVPQQAVSGARPPADQRHLPPSGAVTETRWDPLRGETVAYAAHRQHRTHLPPADQCPLCPSGAGRDTEVPAADYEVAVFENRFPAFGGGRGRCEVVCFSPDHHASFADLPPERVRLVLDVLTDRTAALARHPGVRQVYCFENRGAEIGVTLPHPHGQIYAFPYVAPHTARVLDSLAAHRAATGGNLADELLAAELSDGSRVVAEEEHWVAFVPYAARWPYEVHLHPRRRRPDLLGLEPAERAEFTRLYPRLLRAFDRLFGAGQPPTPYVAAWHQAPWEPEPGDPDPPHPAPPGHPPAVSRAEFPLHLELFTVRRGPGKLKYLAGTESGAGAFVNDVLPEDAAARLREVLAA